MRQTNKQKTENVLQITGAGKSFLNITGMGSSPTYQQMGQGETNVYAKLRKLSSEHSNSHRMAENLYTSVKGLISKMYGGLKKQGNATAN